MVADEKNRNIFQYDRKNLRDDDEIFRLAFQQDKDLLRYASVMYVTET